MNAELLLMFVLARARAYLYAHPELQLTAEEYSRYNVALAERERGVPAQYIIGHQEFWGMDLIVTPAVLIPRPETEHVVETVLELVGVEKAGTHEWPHQTDLVNIADVGTGSGCIALALAKELPQAKIHATDISAASIEIARDNAARHQLESRIHFRIRTSSRIRGQLSGFCSFQSAVRRGIGGRPVQLEVRKFEPRNAVFAGPQAQK